MARAPYCHESATLCIQEVYVTGIPPKQKQFISQDRRREPHQLRYCHLPLRSLTLLVNFRRAHTALSPVMSMTNRAVRSWEELSHVILQDFVAYLHRLSALAWRRMWDCGIVGS